MANCDVCLYIYTSNYKFMIAVKLTVSDCTRSTSKTNVRRSNWGHGNKLVQVPVNMVNVKI